VNAGIVLHHAPFERTHAGILIREGRDLILDLRAHRIDLVTQALVYVAESAFTPSICCDSANP
jgi:hypothetical protein